MRFLFLACLSTVMTTRTALASPVEVTLAREGQPAATIVIAKEPTRAAQFAAYELQWHLKQVTGGDFRIVDDETPVEQVTILVGDSRRVRAMGIKPDQLIEAGIPDPLHARGVGAGGM